MTDSMAYLARLCRRWGGELLLVSRAQFSLLASLPGRTVHPLGGHAIDVAQRLVVAERRRANSGTVVHEMGHVFLVEGDPERTYEPDWLGWEVALARRAGCYRVWSTQNADYQLPAEQDMYEWRDFRGVELRGKIAELLDDAKAAGFVSAAEEPLCTRRPVA